MLKRKGELGALRRAGRDGRIESRLYPLGRARPALVGDRARPRLRSCVTARVP